MTTKTRSRGRAKSEGVAATIWWWLELPQRALGVALLQLYVGRIYTAMSAFSGASVHAPPP